MIWNFSHNIAFKEDFLKDPIWPYWRDFQERCTKCWNLWHNWWLNEAENSQTPIYFFRFEDMVADKKNELKKLMSFIFGMKGSIKGTVLERRIDEMCAQSESKNQLYKPQTGGTGAGQRKNLLKYTPEQLNYQH